MYLFPRMLFGERPFWWIGESRLFVNNEPNVQQFSATCETGPGDLIYNVTEISSIRYTSAQMFFFLLPRESIWTCNGDRCSVVGGGVLVRVISLLSHSQV